MKITHRKIKQSLCALGGAAALLSTLFTSAVAAAESVPVRAAWFEDAYNITGKNGQKSGYGYEFQQTIAAYTDWTYDYVKAGWPELLKMVQQGDVDLMAGVSYTEERAKSLLYSELPMGTEKYYLYADLANTGITTSDLTSLNGKRIGILEGSIHAEFFFRWEREHGLHLTYVPMTSFEDAMGKIARREIDCLVSAETPDLVKAGMSAIALTGSSGIYFVVNKARPDLKRALDRAMRKLAYDKPLYADELYQRYYSGS